MSASSATLIASALATAVSLLVLLVNVSQNRRLADNSGKLDTIHVLVNDRLDAALARIEVLRLEVDSLKAKDEHA